jgi:hypothetical protein
MSEQPEGLSPERLEKERQLEAAVQRAVREAVLASAYAGQSAPIWRDGKVVWLTPDEIFKELNAPPLAKPDDKAGAA